jgi:hypothetical protein
LWQNNEKGCCFVGKIKEEEEEEEETREEGCSAGYNFSITDEFPDKN